MFLRWEFPSIESRELKDHWHQLWTENVYSLEKFFQFRIAVQQDFFMGDGLWTFTENTKFSGVRAAALLTVRGVGQA
jgi:hypothetical protein